MFYYLGFSHKNSTDEEEKVVEISGTKTEKRKVHSIIITAVENAAYLSAYVERDKVIEDFDLDGLNIQNGFEIPLDIMLEEGVTFKIKLKNKVSGTNAAIRGLIKYEIV